MMMCSKSQVLERAAESEDETLYHFSSSSWMDGEVRYKYLSGKGRDRTIKRKKELWNNTIF